MGNKKSDIIEINGKRYDARTGVALSHDESVPNHDRIIASSTHDKSPLPEEPMHLRTARPARHTENPVSRTPSASKILMRKGVKKPGPSLKRRIKVQGQVWLNEQRLIDNLEGIPTTAEKQLLRAAHVQKSQFVSHFPPSTATAAATTHHALSRSTPVATSSLKVSGVSTAESFTPPSARQPETTSELLERALREAPIHEQKALNRPRHSHLKRQTGVIVAAAVAVAIISVIASQNLPSARLQIASVKAGFTAKLPDYVPAGFSQGQLNYSAGVVAASFHSHGDERNYTVTQKTSSWSSTTLRDSFVKPIDPNYETILASGRTIYIYGNHNATWISAGIWYVVQTNGALSNHQLVELAASL